MQSPRRRLVYVLGWRQQFNRMCTEVFEWGVAPVEVLAKSETESGGIRLANGGNVGMLRHRLVRSRLNATADHCERARGSPRRRGRSCREPWPYLG